MKEIHLKRLPQIDHVRAIAQLLIVAAHVPFLLVYSSHETFFQFVRPFYDNATVLFLMLSGYLFARQGIRFSYKDFVLRKAQVIAFPYVLALTPLMVTLFFFPEVLARYWNLAGLIPSPTWVVLLTARNPMNVALWFFPLIFSFFLLSGLFKWILQRDRVLLAVLVVSFALSFWGHRPRTTAQLYHSILYFIFPYALGLALYKWEETFEKIYRKAKWILLAGFVGIYLWQALMMEQGGFDRLVSLSDLTWDHVDIGLVQKCLFTLLLYFYFKSLQRRTLLSGFLERVANASFGIHLYHFYFISTFLWFWGRQSAPVLAPLYFGFFAAVVSASWLWTNFLTWIHPALVGRENQLEREV